MQFAGPNITSSLPITLETEGGTFDTLANNATLSGTISGPGALTKIGTGTLTLIGTNTYSGGTSFNRGIIAVNSDANLGTGPLSFNGGTLEILAAGGGITSNKPVTLNTGGGTFLTDANTTSTLSGVISGPGALTKAGGGTLILTGDNTYTGGTNFNGGILELGNGGNTGDIVGDVNNNGTLMFDHSNPVTFSGVINGSGNLVKVGTGTLTLTADDTYSGATTILDGTLVAGVPNAAQEISNALGTGDVFLEPGTLRTSSLETGNPLTINVRGNYRQSPAGTLSLGIGGTQGEQYDRVQVGGNASLNGTLAVSSLNNFRPSEGNVFEVLRSNGTTSGQFAHVNDFLNNNPNLERIDLYAPNGVALVYVAAAPGPTPPVPTPSPTPNPRPPIDVEDPKPLPPVNPEEPLQLPDVLAILDPTAEELTALYEISFSGANTQRFKLDERFADIQRGSTGFTSNLPVPPTPSGGKEVIGQGKAPPPALVPSPQNRWGVWANGWGDWVSVDNDGTTRGYDFRTGGFIIGVDYRITDYLAIGAMGSYAYTRANLQPSGDIDVNTGRGGLYFTYFSHGGFYINGAAYGGHNSYNTSRQGLLGAANGSTSGGEFSTFGQTGYDFHFGDFTVGPLFALQYTLAHVDGFNERGSLVPLNIHSDSETSFRTDVGARASYTWQVGKSILLIPSLTVAWEHEYFYSAVPITVSSPLFPGQSQTFFGPSEGHNSVIVNPLVEVRWTPAFSTFVGYQGQLGRSRYNANAVTGGFSFSF